MKKIELKDRIIYRADEKNKIKFANDETLYSEICVKKGDEREVEEVENGNS